MLNLLLEELRLRTRDLTNDNPSHKSLNQRRSIVVGQQASQESGSRETRAALILTSKLSFFVSVPRSEKWHPQSSHLFLKTKLTLRLTYEVGGEMAFQQSQLIL